MAKHVAQGVALSCYQSQVHGSWFTVHSPANRRPRRYHVLSWNIMIQLQCVLVERVDVPSGMVYSEVVAYDAFCQIRLCSVGNIA